MMKKNLILSVLLVALAAGCTSAPPTIDVNKGVVINEFTALPSSATEGRTVLFDIEVQNVGGTTGRSVTVELLGVEGQWRDRSGNLLTGTQSKDIGTLRPPDAKNNIQGQSGRRQWELVTPDIPQGISSELKIQARVTYEYNTSGRLVIPAISSDELERKQILKQSIALASVENSNGPIKITLSEKHQQAAIVDRDEPTPTVHPLRIDFTNVGGDGFPITQGQTGKLRGTITLFGPAAEFEDCLGVKTGRTVNLDSAEIAVKLRESGTAPVGCSIRIKKPEWGNRAEDTIGLDFNIFYTYFVPASETVKVFGK